MILRAALPLALLAAAPAWAQAPGQATALPVTPIDPARLSQIDRALSDDALGGRSPGSAAEARVVDVLVAQLKAAGVQPGAEGGGWTQDVPLMRLEASGPVAVSLTSAKGPARELRQGEDVAVRTLQPVDRVEIGAAPLVFCGYGVRAPELGWDDFKGVDLHGKVAVVLANDPDYAAPEGAPVAGRFGGRALSAYGGEAYKAQAAARAGAAGLLVVHEAGPAGRDWGATAAAALGPQYDLVRDDPAAAHPQLQGWLRRDVAAELFRKAGLDLDALSRRAQSAGFRPVALKGASFSAAFAVTRSRLVSHNVLGRLKGARRPQETVIYTAHWDHLAPGASGGRIDGGAVEAGGAAALVELARVFARAPRTERSVLFMATTAGATGRLGAEAYAARPAYPLATTAAVLDIGRLATAGPARDVSLEGDARDTLQDELAAAAAREGRTVSPDPAPEAGGFLSAGAFPLAARGVPAISVGSGEDLYVGGREAGKAWADAYARARRDGAPDPWSPGMDWRGVALDAGLLYDVGRTVANGAAWPAWKAGSEFRATRDATAAQRGGGA